ncbi:MAG: tetratricopeptide repeat protein [Fimbriimonadaceae bacterium]|nr:tetratricopeptide repeat protein [Fimbriimonadaceae bacterium]
MERTRWTLLLLVAWLGLAWGQAPPPPTGSGGGGPGGPAAPAGEGGEATSGDALGGQQAVKKVRDILILPFVNETGDAAKDFWAQPLAELLQGTPEAQMNSHTAERAPDLLEAFMAGRRSARNEADRRLALAALGGDTVLVGYYTAGADSFKIRAEAFDATDLNGKAVGSADVSGSGGYQALHKLAAALSTQIGLAAAQSTAGPGGAPGAPGAPDGDLNPSGGAGMPGMPAMPGMPGAPPPPAGSGAPGGPAMPPGAPGAPGAPGMPGMPGAAPDGLPAGEGGGPAPAPEVVVADLDIEQWARGIHAWPFSSPRQAHRGDLEAALRFFEKQITVEPLFNLGYSALALASIAVGEPERGIAVQRAWTEAQDDRAADWHNLGVVLAAAERTDEAVAALRKSLAAKDGPIAIDQLLIAVLYAGDDRWDEAAVAAREATEKYPFIREGHLVLGEALLQTRKYKEAVPPLQMAVAMNPVEVDGYEQLTKVWLQQKHATRAITVARTATERAAGDAAAWLLLADTQLALGRASAAQVSAQKAVQLDGQSPQAHQKLGEVQLQLGALDAAAGSFQQASNLQPGWNRPRRFLAQARLLGDQLEVAGKLLEEALALATPEDLPATCRDLARTAFYAGDNPRAIELLRVAEDAEPGLAETKLLRALVRLYQADEAGAWEDFVAALEGLDARTRDEAVRVLQGATKTTAQPTALVMLGVLYERLNQVDKARDVYRRYRAAAPRGVLIDYVKERLDATETKRATH